MAKHSVEGASRSGRAGDIHKWCKEGGAVILKRELDNPHDKNAIAIFIVVKKLFGLIKSEYHLGYVRATSARKMAPKLDNNESYNASVSRLYAPNWRSTVDITIDVVFQ